MANHTERIGLYNCAAIAENNGWMFREQPINDIGIDAHIEHVDKSGVSKLIALQIKSGNSWFKEIKEGTVIFRAINTRQYHYWTKNSLPCILVLYNPDDNKCIWQKLTIDTIEKTKDGLGKGFYVKVPINQIFLDLESNMKLLSFSNLPEHIINYNFLLSQREFMEIIDNGGTVKLHSNEWVNKSSGRGEIELIVCKDDKKKIYKYPYWFPYTPYEDVFKRLFPWAEFYPDEDFYWEQDVSLWKKLHCYYDKENDEWINVGMPFEKFRDSLEPMRFINHSNEVAEYMLILKLNDLGKAFLKVNSFVSQDQAYSELRPKKE